MIAENTQPFDQMILERTKSWTEDYDTSNRGRIEQAVTMAMRNRSDYFGYFYNGTSTSSRWRPYTGKGMVTFPIIGRSVRSKTATACGTKVQIQIEPIRAIPEKIAACDMARNITKFLRGSLWTQPLESALAETGQLMRFSFLYSTFHKTGGTIIDLPETATQPMKTGQTLYVCHSCGDEFDSEQLGIQDIADEFADADLSEDELADSAEPMQASDAMPASASVESADPVNNYGDAPIDGIPVDPDSEQARIMDHTKDLVCPNCGTNTLILESRARYEKQQILTGKYRKADCGVMETRLISPLLIRYDTYSSIGFEYKRATWFNYHPLIPAYEMLASSPQLREHLLTGRNHWSESARVHYELNNSGPNGYSYRGKSYDLDDLIEVDCWWIQPHAFAGWQSPSDWELPLFSAAQDGAEFEPSGETFHFKEGETVEQAYMRQFGRCTGVFVIIHNDFIVGLGDESFTHSWVGNAWKVDSQSGVPQGEENQLSIQDAATNVLGLFYSHVKRRGASKMVVDPMGGFTEQAITKSNAPGGIIVREPMSAAIAERNWQNYIGYLEPGELGDSVYQFVQLIISIAKEESGVFNETVGNVEDSETLGGRKMALGQSLSLMTPSQQNKGQTLREQYYVWLELWQQNAPDEAYQLIKGTYEEEWKPQDIKAFKELNIRQELDIAVVEGTDIPRTLTEMEERYMAALNLGMFDPASPLPLQIRQEIVKRVLGIDMDVGNYDANKRAAARRFEFIKTESERLVPSEAFTIMPDPMSGLPTRKLNPMIMASLMQDPRTKVREDDEHLVFIEFWIDKINGLAGADQPDEVLIEMLEETKAMHRAMVTAKTAQMNAAMGFAQQAGMPPPAQLGEGNSAQAGAMQ